MDSQNTQLEKLVDTDLWYRTWTVRGDGHSLYIFAVNERQDQEWKNIF
ncbi:hypothetical protein [Clostridium sp. Marseille-Q7071]